MIKTAQGLIPSAHLRDSVAIRVNITSVNDPPVLGRRVALTCDPSLADRKMACPLGPNDPAPLRCDGTGGCTATDLGQLKTWTQVPPPPRKPCRGPGSGAGRWLCSAWHLLAGEAGLGSPAAAGGSHRR